MRIRWYYLLPWIGEWLLHRAMRKQMTDAIVVRFLRDQSKGRKGT